MQMPDGTTLIGPTDMPELCWAPSGGYYVGRIRREPPSGSCDPYSFDCAQAMPLAYSGGSNGTSASSVALRRPVSLSFRLR